MLLLCAALLRHKGCPQRGLGPLDRRFITGMSCRFLSTVHFHLRLDRCYAGRPAAERRRAVGLAYVPRLDLTVDIKRYGDGVLSVIIV